MASDGTGRFAILEQLAADGVTYLFGNPGTVEQGFLDALADVPQITYIETLQESIAVAIADAYARGTQRVAAIQLHSSPGLGNGIGMIYQAKRGEAPLVVIIGDAGTQYEHMDAQMAADLVAIAEPVTKWATKVIHPDSVLRVMRRAVKIASTPPRGPVFVALPMDVLDAPSHEQVHESSIPVIDSTPSAASVATIADALAKATNPILIVGDGIAQQQASAELVALAEAAGAPVWEANGAEVNMPFGHPLYRGGLGHMFGNVSKDIVRSADVVLISGTYVFPEVFPELRTVFAHGARVFHVDLNAYEIAKNFPVELGVVADPKVTLPLLAEAVLARQDQSAAAAAQARRDASASARQKSLEAKRAADEASWGATPLKPSEFMAALAARLPESAIIFDEALTTSPDVKDYLGRDEPGTYFQTRGGSLGVGIPGAIGLKLAHPDRTVVGFTGDGGSMYTIQALWTAAHHRVDAKFVVCNNRSYKLLKQNIQRYWQDIDHEEREFPTSFEITDPDLDFVSMAKGMGVDAARVERPEDIEPAIERMLSTPGPFLIDLVIDSTVANHHVYCCCGQ